MNLRLYMLLSWRERFALLDYLVDQGLLEKDATGTFWVTPLGEDYIGDGLNAAQSTPSPAADQETN